MTKPKAIELTQIIPHSRTEKTLLDCHNRRIAQMVRFTEIENTITKCTHEWHKLIMDIAHCENTGNWKVQKQLQKRLMPLTEKVDNATRSSEVAAARLEELSATYRQAAIAFHGTLTLEESEKMFGTPGEIEDQEDTT